MEQKAGRKNQICLKRVRALTAALEREGFPVLAITEWRASGRQHLSFKAVLGSRVFVVGGAACSPGDTARGDRNFVAKAFKALSG